jgi:hypothetical protein
LPAIWRAWTKRTLELLQKLGAGMAEDILRNPDASARKFGVTPEQAQAEIDKLIADAGVRQEADRQGSGGRCALAAAQRGRRGRQGRGAERAAAA